MQEPRFAFWNVHMVGIAGAVVLVKLNLGRVGIEVVGLVTLSTGLFPSTRLVATSCGAPTRNRA